jgi:transglutaminase-like putative cysteine protease
MHLSIRHNTIYQYSEPLIYSIQQLKLTPKDGFGQSVKNWTISVNAHLHHYQDCYGNMVHTAVIDNQHHEISIIAKGEVETGLKVLSNEEPLPLGIFLRSTSLTAADAALQAFASQFSPLQNVEDLEKLGEAIIAKVPYHRGTTGVYTSASQAFSAGAGVCQDHAHIFIACCRSLAVPARYVSGYLFTDDGHLLDSHAWADAWLAGIGWVSMDVSNLCLADVKHVRLATGLDYHEASPVKGLRVGGGMETLHVGVSISQSAELTAIQMQQSQQ